MIKAESANLEQILDSAIDFFSADVTYILLPDTSGNLKVSAYTGMEGDALNLYLEGYQHAVEALAFETRAPILIQDTSKDPRFLVGGSAEFPGRSILSFPVSSGDRVLAVMGLQLLKSGGFNQDSVKKIGRFNDTVLRLLEQDRQEEAVRIKDGKIDLINEITSAIHKPGDLKTLVDTVTQHLNNRLSLKSCDIIFFNNSESMDNLAVNIRKLMMTGLPGRIDTEDGMPVFIVPILSSGGSVGFIRMKGGSAGEYSNIMRTLGILVGSGYARIKQDMELLSNRSEMEALHAIAEYELSSVFSSSSDLSQILEATLEVILKLVRVERMNIMLYHREEKILQVQAYWGVDDHPLGRDILRLGEGVAGRALETGQPLYVNLDEDNPESDRVFVKSPSDRKEVKSIMAYPLIVEGRKIGVINLGSLYRSRLFSEEESRKISLVATRAALAIENSILMKDRLGLMNELAGKNTALEKKTRELSERGKRLTNITRQLQSSLEKFQNASARLTELFNFSREISGTLDLKTILDSGLEHIYRELSSPVRVIAISLLDRNMTRYRVASSDKLGAKFISGAKIEKEIPPDIYSSIVSQGQQAILERIEDHPEYADFKPFKGFRSFYAFPLKSGERVLGLLILASRKENILNREDLQYLNSINNNLAVAVGNAVSFEDLEQYSQKLSFLNRMTQELIFSLNKTELWDKIVELSSQLLDFRTAVLLLYDDAGNLRTASRRNVDYDFLNRLARKEVVHIFNEIIIQKKIFCYNPEDETRGRRFSLIRSTSSESFVILPLYSRNRAIGALILGDDKARTHNERVLDFYTLLAHQVALIIDSVQLFGRIAEEKEKIESVFKSMKDGVISVDWERRITAFNRGAEEITGWKAGEVLGKPCYSVVNCRVPSDEHKNCRDVCCLIDILESKTTANSSARTEGRLVNRDGQERIISFIVSLLSRDEMPVGGVIIIRDITEEKMDQQQRADYLAAISHDIFTPLTAIKNYATTLLLHGREFDEETRNEFVKIISSEIDRITRLLFNMISLSRMETERLKANIQPVLVKDVISKVADIYSLNSKIHTITVDESIEKAPAVLVDRDHLDQILNNLLSNAIKYSPGGGDIKISSSSDGEFLTLSVQDHGIGIEKIDMDRIFKSYERVSTRVTKKVSGMGLGLFITKKLVELQEGRIWAEQAPEGGSRFNFTLPLLKKSVQKTV